MIFRAKSFLIQPVVGASLVSQRVKNPPTVQETKETQV